MACDGRTAPVRSEFSFNVNDVERGSVKFEFYDRISVDDLFLHLVRRQLYLLAGGGDPGDDVNQTFKDFLIRENYLDIK
jgi:hypothetical protein